MIHKLDQRCGVCSSWTWCGRPCANKPVPNKPAPVISQPDSVISQAGPVISRVISRVISQGEGRSDYDRVRDWRARHPETHRARHAAYMRQWRAQKKSPGL